MKLAGSLTEKPLLSQREINALIQAARPSDQRKGLKIKRGARAGEFPTSSPGSGTDLADLRAYHPGDDTRHIDWRASARSRQPVLRTWFSELNHPFFVVLDRRAAMRFGTRCRLKVTQAARLAISLLAREARSGREVGGLIMDTPCHWVPPRHGMGAALRLIDLMISAAPPCNPEAAQGIWSKALSELSQRLPEGAELILISDFSDLDSQDEFSLRSLGGRLAARAVQIADPLELSMTLPCPLQLQWGNRQLRCQHRDADELQQYREQEAHYQSLLGERFVRAAIPLMRLTTQQDDLQEIMESIST